MSECHSTNMDEIGRTFLSGSLDMLEVEVRLPSYILVYLSDFPPLSSIFGRVSHDSFFASKNTFLSFRANKRETSWNQKCFLLQLDPIHLQAAVLWDLCPLLWARGWPQLWCAILRHYGRIPQDAAGRGFHGRDGTTEKWHCWFGMVWERPCVASFFRFRLGKMKNVLSKLRMELESQIRKPGNTDSAPNLLLFFHFT